MNFNDLQQVDAGAWIAIVALCLALVLILIRSRAWARQEVQQATQDLEGLSQFHRSVLAELSLERVLAQLTGAIAPGMGFQTARVYLLDKETRSLSAGEERADLPGSALLEAMFSPSQWSGQGLLLLPLADATPVNAVPQCWQAPETRCTVTPSATMATRETQCPGCANFAVLGVLAVSHFGHLPSGATRLREYGDATALAVKNARLYESQAQERSLAQRKASQLELIYEVGREVMQAQNEREILERLTDKLLERLGVEQVQIALRHGDAVHLVLKHENSQRTWIKLGETADQTLTEVAIHGSAQTVGTSLTVPIVFLSSTEPRSIGSLRVTHPAEAVDFSLLSTVAAQTGLSLHNFKELQTLRQNEREAQALVELSRRFAAPFNRDPEGRLSELCDAIRAYVGAATFITTLEVTGTVQTRAIASSFGAALHYPPGEDNLTNAVMISRRSVLTENTLESPLGRVEAAAFGAVSVLSVPLLSGERFVGALHAIKPDGFSPGDVQKLERVGQQVALVLDNLELLHSLKLEGERLENVLENLAEGVIVFEDSATDSLIPELTQTTLSGLGRANAVARTLLNLPERFPMAQLPAQLRATLEQESSSLTLGDRRFQVLVKRATSQRSVVVLQDVSAFEDLERTKAQFLGIVSHELRTPLTAIIGFNELMLSGAVGTLSPEQDQFLHTTLTASHNLHQTVQNLLVASNLEAGLFELHTRVSRVNLKKSLERFKTMALEKNVKLTLDVPEPQRLNLDAERVGLVLENLVANAVRYTPSGGQVRVAARIAAGRLDASVSDTGGGLRPDQETNLFQKFARNAQKSKEGAGIALYVSSAIVRASGGLLWAENHPGQGLTMHLRVPIPEPDEADETPKTATRPPRMI